MVLAGVGAPPMSTGSTRCSGIHTESKPRRSASSVTSTHAVGLSRPSERANFTVVPVAVPAVGWDGCRRVEGPAPDRGSTWRCGRTARQASDRPAVGHSRASTGRGTSPGASPKARIIPSWTNEASSVALLGEHLAPHVGHAAADLGALVVVEQPAVPGHRIVEGHRDGHHGGGQGPVGLGGADPAVRPRMVAEMDRWPVKWATSARARSARSGTGS